MCLLSEIHDVTCHGPGSITSCLPRFSSLSFILKPTTRKCVGVAAIKGYTAPRPQNKRATHCTVKSATTKKQMTIPKTKELLKIRLFLSYFSFLATNSRRNFVTVVGVTHASVFMPFRISKEVFVSIWNRNISSCYVFSLLRKYV